MGAAITAVAVVSVLLQTAAQPVSLSDLDQEPTRWHGARVEVEGEIVGDYGLRTGEIWVQLNDDPYVAEPLPEEGSFHGGNVGLGVRLPPDLPVTEWGPPGGDEHRGPIVAVVGEFRYNDPQAGGDTFIDAHTVRLIEPSRPMRARPIDRVALTAGLLLTAAGVVVFWLARRSRLLPAGASAAARRGFRSRRAPPGHPDG